MEVLHLSMDLSVWLSTMYSEGLLGKTFFFFFRSLLLQDLEN